MAAPFETRARTAIEAIRKTVAGAENPVLLFTGGARATVLAHLAGRAFAPACPPLPLLHVDSTWEFGEVLEHRHRLAAACGFQLVVHHNEDGRRMAVDPLAQPALHTALMRGEARAQALAFGGYDATLASDAGDDPGEIPVTVPLAGWSDADIWRYHLRHGIEPCPLHLARERPVATHRGRLIVIDDPDRARRIGLAADDTARVRIDTPGCWPLTPATPSRAADIRSALEEAELAAGEADTGVWTAPVPAPRAGRGTRP